MDAGQVLLSAVIAAGVSGIVSLVTAWVTINLQSKKEERAWQRSARVDEYSSTLVAFQESFSSAMAVAREQLLSNVVNAGSQSTNELPHESSELLEARERLESSERQFIEARTRALVVGSPEIVQCVERMSNLISVAGTDARKGADIVTSPRWLDWAAEGRRLREAFANESRKSLGFSELPHWALASDWPQLEDAAT